MIWQSICRLRPFGLRVDDRVKDSIREILFDNPDIDSIFTIENDILIVTKEVILNDVELSKQRYSCCCFDYSGALDGTSTSSVMQIPTFTLGYVAGDFMARQILEQAIRPVQDAAFVKIDHLALKRPYYTFSSEQQVFHSS